MFFMPLDDCTRRARAALAALLLLGGVAGAQTQPQPPPAAPAGRLESLGGDAYVVFLGGRMIGREELAISRQAEGWVLRGTGAARRAGRHHRQARRGALRRRSGGRSALELAATVQGTEVTLKTTFADGKAVNALTEAGKATEKIDPISADPVVLPNVFFGSYAALAARLSRRSRSGAELKAYIAPQAEIPVVVTDVTTERIETPRRDLRGPALRAGDEEPQRRPAGHALGRRGGRPGAAERAVAVARSGARGRRLGGVADDRVLDSRRRVGADCRQRLQPRRHRDPAEERREAAARGGADRRLGPGRPRWLRRRRPGDRRSSPRRWPRPASWWCATTSAASARAAAGRRPRRSTDYADDARAVVNYLRKERKDVDDDRVAVVGHSEGAWVALQLGANTGDVRALGLIAGASGTGGALVLEQQQHLLDVMKVPDTEKKAKAELQMRINAAATGQGSWDGVPGGAAQAGRHPVVRQLPGLRSRPADEGRASADPGRAGRARPAGAGRITPIGWPNWPAPASVRPPWRWSRCRA